MTTTLVHDEDCSGSKDIVIGQKASRIQPVHGVGAGAVIFAVISEVRFEVLSKLDGLYGLYALPTGVVMVCVVALVGVEHSEEVDVVGSDGRLGNIRSS